VWTCQLLLHEGQALRERQKLRGLQQLLLLFRSRLQLQGLLWVGWWLLLLLLLLLPGLVPVWWCTTAEAPSLWHSSLSPVLQGWPAALLVPCLADYVNQAVKLVVIQERVLVQLGQMTQVILMPQPVLLLLLLLLSLLELELLLMVLMLLMLLVLLLPVLLL